MNLKTLISTKGRRLAVASVLAGGLLVGGVTVAANAAGGTGCATLTYPLCARSVAKPQVVDGSLDGVEIKDGSLEAKDIAPADRDAFLKDTPDVKGGAKLVAVYNEMPIENTGGSWTARKTQLGSFKLPAGTWLVNTSAFFRRTALNNDSAGNPITATRPQLALRAFITDAKPFGSDFGTVMGQPISPVLEGDLTGSDVRLITVTEETTVGVYAFGYQDDRGSTDSGKIEVLRATIVAVRA